MIGIARSVSKAFPYGLKICRVPSPVGLERHQEKYLAERSIVHCFRHSSMQIKFRSFRHVACRLCFKGIWHATPRLVNITAR